MQCYVYMLKKNNMKQSNAETFNDVLRTCQSDAVDDICFFIYVYIHECIYIYIYIYTCVEHELIYLVLVCTPRHQVHASGLIVSGPCEFDESCAFDISEEGG